MGGNKLYYSIAIFCLLIYLLMPIRNRKGYCDHYNAYKYAIIRSELNSVITDSICSICKQVSSSKEIIK